MRHIAAIAVLLTLAGCGSGADESGYLSDARAVSHGIAQLGDDALLDIGYDVCDLDQSDGPDAALDLLAGTLGIFVDTPAEAEAWRQAAVDHLC